MFNPIKRSIEKNIRDIHRNMFHAISHRFPSLNPHDSCHHLHRIFPRNFPSISPHCFSQEILIPSVHGPSSNFTKKNLLVGGFNPSEKYESQMGLLFPIHGKIKNGPNHQPDYWC